MEKTEVLPQASLHAAGVDVGRSQSSSPPPYASCYDATASATAYPRPKPRRRLILRHRMPIKAISATLITSLVLFLYALVWRIGWRNDLTTTQQPSLSEQTLLEQRYQESLEQCARTQLLPPKPPPPGERAENPRWNSQWGQDGTLVLRNATLFDGEVWADTPVDIVLSKGLIESVTTTSSANGGGGTHGWPDDALIHDLEGRYVTPGLVDMHSHHLADMWPSVGSVNEDGNEMNPKTSWLTPQVRVLDSLKPDDVATRLIAAGGVTSSLIIPGSANLIGGEGVTVKNAAILTQAGAEPVVEELLLEHGVPEPHRRRYMKMASGENPKRVWEHTRMGSAWGLREHLQKAKELRQTQDEYCAAATSIRGDRAEEVAVFVRGRGHFPIDLGLESTVAMLRGQVMAHNHNYETEDMERMLRIADEFGFRIWGFHHAIEAWQIPELLRRQGQNVTIATFAEMALYKWESYSPSLSAGRILNEHEVAVAYKSDHAMELTSARYLVWQAAVGHAFRLPEEKALQAVTSTPARALDLDWRVGYCRKGYDADVVVWDSHPLALGSTPLQVFIDGVKQLKDEDVMNSVGTTFDSQALLEDEADQEGSSPRATSMPQVKYEPEEALRMSVCSQAEGKKRSYIISGIKKASIAQIYPELQAMADQSGLDDGSVELVIEAGRAACLSSAAACSSHTARIRAAADFPPVEIALRDGHLLPGLTALTSGLGMREIAVEPSTGDGEASGQKLDDPASIQRAGRGIWLDGKGFARARMGGVTRAVTPPVASEGAGLVLGVSAEILTSGRFSMAEGGLVKGEVALHLNMGDPARQSEGTVSNGIRALRRALGGTASGSLGENADDDVVAKVAKGEMPLVVRCDNKYDMAQLIFVKKDFPTVRLVIVGGKEAPYVAKELAEADIPVILSEDRPAPDVFRGRDAIVGPPLTRSVGRYLAEAGVKFALAVIANDMPADFRIHDLGPEAGWTAKWARLTDEETVALVTSNVETILGLEPSRDLVVFEGDPLKLGATVVLGFHGHGDGQVEVATCFPQEHDSGPRAL